MALVAGAVITRARDFHPALSVMNAPRPIMLRELTNAAHYLSDMIYVRVPGFLAQRVNVALPLADFASGVDLVALIPGGWSDLTEIAFRLAQEPDPNNLVPAEQLPFEQRTMRTTIPAVYLRDNVLYLAGVAADYTAFSQIAVFYTPMPAEITSELATLTLPDDAKEALAAKIAGNALTRLVGNPLYKITREIAKEFRDRGDAECKDFLTRIWRITQRQSYRVRDVR